VRKQTGRVFNFQEPTGNEIHTPFASPACQNLSIAQPSAHVAGFCHFLPISEQRFVCLTADGILLAYMWTRQKKAQIQIKKQHQAAEKNQPVQNNTPTQTK
jgi:hypothetical protein